MLPTNFATPTKSTLKTTSSRPTNGHEKSIHGSSMSLQCWLRSRLPCFQISGISRYTKYWDPFPSYLENQLLLYTYLPKFSPWKSPSIFRCCCCWFQGGYIPRKPQGPRPNGLPRLPKDLPWIVWEKLDFKGQANTKVGSYTVALLSGWSCFLVLIVDWSPKNIIKGFQIQFLQCVKLKKSRLAPHIPEKKTPDKFPNRQVVQSMTFSSLEVTIHHWSKKVTSRIARFFFILLFCMAFDSRKRLDRTKKEQVWRNFEPLEF